MTGKNTAAFGLYRTQADVEYAVDLLRAEGFRNTDISVLFPENKGTKDSPSRRTPKRRKELPPEPLLALWSEEPWVGLSVLARWQSLESAR